MMKKFLLSLIALLGMSTYVLADGFSVADVEIKQGGSGVLELVFNSSFYGRSFQLDMDLPEGIVASDVQKGEAVTAGVGKYMLDGNIYEGAYRVAYTDFDGSILESGVAAYITLNDTQGYAVGTELTVTVKNQEYLYQETAEAGSRLVKENPADFTFKIKIVENVMVLDETSTTAPEAAENQTVLVKRSIKKDVWNTICLPFAMTEAQVVSAFGEDAQVADFTGCEASGEDGDYSASIKVKFSSVTSIEANHPYLIKVATPITYEEGFKVEGVTISPEEDIVNAQDHERVKVGTKWYDYYNNFYGTYIAGTEVPAGSIILSGNKFYITKGTTTKGFRGWFFFDNIAIQDIEEAMADAGVKISLDGDATAIEYIDGVKVNAEGWYDMSGRKLNDKPTMKGIYINNGKKQLVK